MTEGLGDGLLHGPLQETYKTLKVFDLFLAITSLLCRCLSQ